jgi:hypothetical protein
LAPLRDVVDFAEHEAKARELGFELFVKRAGVNGKKHVRVRPRFDRWSAAGSVTVLDERIDKATLQTILTQGGAYVGLGDWRPGSPTPGSWGRFTAQVQAI